ncbi:MAG: mannose-1-phosphate guanylyltransferase [Spirochaetaceae bacterium]|jgi:mannose-1-phosphate guanylyltransferase/mannose-1-phosphate guanylyltransferase/mannose-6-phosphate isomerase|nr:mannose-1-phosphate guanylyltransferase [Spirochaetaceae bacterium]
MFDDCIIMAGGSGTRLWPASTSRFPKQFLPGPGGKSFFLQALERGLALTPGNASAAPPGRVIVIAGKGHAAHAAAACAALPAEERGRILLLIEPLARNTAPAIACGTVFAELTRGERNILVLTSDHSIEPAGEFRAAAAAAAACSRENLVLFGIKPGRPETGYGYIEAAEAANRTEAAALYRVASFREKPERAEAERFLAAGNFYWNSGMFAFSSSFMREEFRRSAPEILRPFERLESPPEGAFTSLGGIRALENWPGLAGAYAEAEPISLDYAIAEKCRRTLMVAGSFRWLDAGSWDEYARLMDGAAGQGAAGVYAVPGGGSCFVDADIPVALCGVEDLIVVIRSGKNGPPAALIAKKGETQRVRDIVEQLRSAGREDLL